MSEGSAETSSVTHATPVAALPAEPRPVRVSALAVIESLLAVGTSLWIVIRFETYAHVALSATLAPLLLLRTRRSTRLALWLNAKRVRAFRRLDRAFLRRLYDVLDKPSDNMVLSTLTGVVALPTLASVIVFEFIAYPAIKTMATVWTATRHPFEGLKAIPGNWARVVFEVSTAVPPELLPGVNERYGKRKPRSRLSRLHFMWWVRHAPVPPKLDDPRGDAERLVAWLFVTVVLFLPALAYRWSLKATSLIYLPLLWIVSSMFPSKYSVEQWLVTIRSALLSKIALAYSVAFLIAFLGKVVLMMLWLDMSAWWNESAWRTMIAPLVAPTSIPLWQIASALNAGLGIALFFYADHVLFDRSIKVRQNDQSVHTTLSTVTGIRVTLTVYTILTTLYIIWTAASEWQWPSIDNKLFPWQQ